MKGTMDRIIRANSVANRYL